MKQLSKKQKGIFLAILSTITILATTTITTVTTYFTAVHKVEEQDINEIIMALESAIYVKTQILYWMGEATSAEKVKEYADALVQQNIVIAHFTTELKQRGKTADQIAKIIADAAKYNPDKNLVTL